MSSLSRVTGSRGLPGRGRKKVGKAGSCARSWRIRGCRVRETGDACDILDFHIPGFGFYPLSSGAS